MQCPYYHLVPKTLQHNIAFRREMLKLGSESKSSAYDLWLMCSRDILFYINTFWWTYDPRRDPSGLPFITYEFQDEAILEMNDSLGKRDMVIEKSRDMGASYITLALFEWRWHFFELQSFMCVSRKEDMVDKKGDPDCLFWKIDYTLKNQPEWLKPAIGRTDLIFENKENGSTITGSSTTGDVGRGGRKTGMLLDEFASVENSYNVLSATADTTKCRLFNSTPKGTGNAFYEVAHNGDIKKFRFHWTSHPEKNHDLYSDLNGKPRSSWYDAECKRRYHPAEIAQELDIDYLGSGYQFFDQDILDRVCRENCRDAYISGDLIFDPKSLEVTDFIHNPKGAFRLWTVLDGKNRLPDDREYVVSADIATGTGASNSALSIGDQKTNEKVGEYVNAKIKPSDLAKLAVAISQWLKGPSGRGAYLIWEANGPGREFGATVLELGYRFVFYRKNEKSIRNTPSDFPGWWSSTEDKLALLGEYRKALSSGVFINRSKEAVYECREYVYMPNGEVAHSRANSTPDPSGARENHGDRVISDALLWRGMKEVPAERPPEEKQTPAGSFMFRRERAAEKARKKEFW